VPASPPGGDRLVKLQFYLPCSLGVNQFGSSKRQRAARESRVFEPEDAWTEVGDFMRLLLKFLRDEKGATAIEYGLIAAGISLAIISIVNGMGAKLNTKFTSINSSLK
jgi:pilus assembly protein Flp/PilA